MTKLKIKHLFLAMGLIIIFFISIFLSKNEIYINDLNKLKTKNTSQVCISKNCFFVEIADTAQKRENGLMNRKNVPNNSGMFFIFKKEGNYTFWMRNTLISLDIIWIDKNNKIIYIEKNAQPCTTEQCKTFGPDQKAKYILEINGGLAGEMGFKAGDIVVWQK